jgi:hypothetical protein
MNLPRRWLGLVVLLVALPGCGPKSSLKGKVTYEGADIERGYLALFSVEDPQRVVGSEIIQGQYATPGFPPGKYKVRINGVPRDPTKADLPEDAPPKMGPRKSVPENATGIGEVIDVIAGHHQRDFNLTAPAPGPEQKEPPEPPREKEAPATPKEPQPPSETNSPPAKVDKPR